MNSKIVTTLTAAITCLSIVSGGAVIYYDKTHDKGNITIDSREEFLSVNQDLMPQTAASIVQGSGDGFPRFHIHHSIRRWTELPEDRSYMNRWLLGLHIFSS